METEKGNPYNLIRYRSTTIAGTELFYREAGEPGKPAILLLHGFPSSSHMFRDLMNWLSPDFHLIAPDYPGCGHSSCPDASTFEYTFDHLAKIVEQFIDHLKFGNLSFYMQDYGGPIGFRIINKRPELVKSLIIQNANVYFEGLGPDVQKIAAMTAANDVSGLEAAINFMISAEGIKEQYVFGSMNQDSISPDSYTMDHYFMEQPGRKAIQKILFQNYNTNFPRYPEWQKYLRNHQPPMLIVWGNNDKIFHGPGALAYQRDVPGAQIHLFEGGHFLLEEYGKAISDLIRNFLNT